MTKDKLLKMIDAYAEGKLIRDWVIYAVDEYSAALIAQNPCSTTLPPQPIKAFKNKATGSIDWRGDHPLSTVYTDEYYLSKPDIWEPVCIT